MQINKTLGLELYRLFGPNGAAQIIHRNEKRRLAALRELERHGLVKIEVYGREESFLAVTRTHNVFAGEQP